MRGLTKLFGNGFHRKRKEKLAAKICGAILSALDTPARPFGAFLITGKAVNTLGLSMAPGEFGRHALQSAKTLPRARGQFP